MTVRNISLPLNVSAAMAAEVGGACILTEVLDLMSVRQMNVEMVTESIERVTDDMTNAQ